MIDSQFKCILIQRSLEIHKNFKNKNIIEINNYFNNNNDDQEDNKEETILKENIINNREEIYDVEDNEDNLSFRRNIKLDEYKDKNHINNNYLTFEEDENEIDKESKEKINKSSINNKIKKIKEKDIERYGIKIKETTYQIKEGNFHIVEKEKYLLNFNFLKNI